MPIRARTPLLPLLCRSSVFMPSCNSQVIRYRLFQHLLLDHLGAIKVMPVKLVMPVVWLLFPGWNRILPSPFTEVGSGLTVHRVESTLPTIHHTDLDLCLCSPLRE